MMTKDNNFFQSNILNNARIARVKFDPTNPEHNLSVKQFVQTGKWGNVKFIEEFPCIDVYTTVMKKIVNHHLGI